MNRDLPYFWIVEYSPCNDTYWRATRLPPFETRREARDARKKLVDRLSSARLAPKTRITKFNRDHWARISGLGEA